MHAYDLISYQSSYHTKSQPSYHSKSYGSGAFSVSGPCMWRTKLPMDLAIFLAETQDTLLRIIRQVETLTEFKIKLKCHFKQ